MQKGKPPFVQASAALRNVSVVQLSALGGLPAGYISCTSMPAYFFIRSIREQGPLIWLPIQAGTASHFSPPLPRYLTGPFTSPFSLIAGPTFSLSAHSLTSSVLALLAPGTQWSQKPIVSLPAACAVRIYGAVISAADDIAVAATNCRRESFLRDMAFSPW